MRQLLALGLVLLGCGFASAQDAWTYPGQYAEPSAPRLSTPIASPRALPTPTLTLDTPPLTVGASNSTLQDATGSPVYYNQPLLYEPGVQYVQAPRPPQSLRPKAYPWPPAEDTESTWEPQPFRWTTAWPSWQVSALERKQKGFTRTRTSPESTKLPTRSSFVENLNA
jgi:hypothetical protein